ncbi:MAG: hypothetical protein QM817_11630 [Archangium sp.]
MKQLSFNAIGVMAGLLLSSGCLIPQDDQVLDELPPRRNTPLRIVNREPEGPQTTFYTQMSCAPPQAFTVAVSDDDTVDPIYSLWFIDQDPNTVPFTTTPKPPSSSTVREIKAPSASTFTNALANLSLGTHLLTVYVADTAFNEVDNQLVTAGPRQVSIPASDGGTVVVPDPGYVDSFTWVLQVERCP